MNPSLEPSLATFRAVRNKKQLAFRDEAFRGILVHWEPVVGAMARHYAPTEADRPDFEQAGRLAVLRAAELFQPRRQVRFENYARRAIRNALLSQLEEGGRRKVTLHFTVSIYDVHDDDDALSWLVKKELRAAVRRACRRLEPRLRTIVEGIAFHDRKQVDLARDLRVTPARVNQLWHRFRSQGSEAFRNLMD